MGQITGLRQNSVCSLISTTQIFAFFQHVLLFFEIRVFFFFFFCFFCFFLMNQTSEYFFARTHASKMFRVQRGSRALSRAGFSSLSTILSSLKQLFSLNLFTRPFSRTTYKSFTAKSCTLSINF